MSVDLSGFRKSVTCGGRQCDEFSNFHFCQIWADDDLWRTSEHYYQALKFPGNSADAADMREEIRSTSSPMDCWKLGNTRTSLLRKDWEEVKVHAMYQANYLKFEQCEHLRSLIVDSKGPICCDGGMFWKTWNEIILERIREELKTADERDPEALTIRTLLMEAYATAVRSNAGRVNQQRAIDAVTKWASKRQRPPTAGSCNNNSVRVEGLPSSSFSGSPVVFRIDSLEPEMNDQPHYVTEDGSWHLYLGKRHSSCAWVIDESPTPAHASGCAYMQVPSVCDLPIGFQSWQVFDGRVHSEYQLAVSVLPLWGT
eukprot:TRINITY_DN48080_c0_g1_i1.p1 TRINITY_DN48080_c0_g1~~TRINITY_DN48080_c0_g1_i1.p1  ORF type:complete len:313 (-),score=63.13 TRINITY_DN48080_c0_g1_i1:98-1036(-)